MRVSDTIAASCAGMDHCKSCFAPGSAHSPDLEQVPLEAVSTPVVLLVELGKGRDGKLVGIPDGFEVEEHVQYNSEQYDLISTQLNPSNHFVGYAYRLGADGLIAWCYIDDLNSSPYIEGATARPCKIPNAEVR